eukprot:6748022-Prymnesium_polylepis.1
MGKGGAWAVGKAVPGRGLGGGNSGPRAGSGRWEQRSTGARFRQRRGRLTAGVEASPCGSSDRRPCSQKTRRRPPSHKPCPSA